MPSSAEPIRTLSMRSRGGSGIGQLDGPIAGIFARVDLEEAGAVEAANETILASGDAELVIARAHESFSLPLGAVLIHCVDVIEFGRQGAANQDFATIGLQIPPALARPGLAIRIGDGHAHPVRRVVAESEVGARRAGRCGDRENGDKSGGEGSHDFAEDAGKRAESPAKMSPIVFSALSPLGEEASLAPAVGKSERPRRTSESRPEPRQFCCGSRQDQG